MALDGWNAAGHVDLEAFVRRAYAQISHLCLSRVVYLIPIEFSFAFCLSTLLLTMRFILFMTLSFL